MQNELNTKCIEAVKLICEKHSVVSSQMFIEWKNDFIEIKLYHPLKPERCILISTEYEEILIEIEYAHLHLPEYEEQDNIPDLIATLSDILDKYISGTISSYAAFYNGKALGGDYTTSPCEKPSI